MAKNVYVYSLGIGQVTSPNLPDIWSIPTALEPKTSTIVIFSGKSSDMSFEQI